MRDRYVFSYAIGLILFIASVSIYASIYGF